MSLFLYIFQVTLSMAVFYAFYYVALRRETLFGVNRLYLLATLVISLILPFLHLDIAQKLIQPELMPAVILLENSFSIFSQKRSTTPVSGFQWPDLFLVIYITGMAFMTMRLLFAFRQIHQIRVNGSSAKINGSDCILSDEVKSPFSFFSTTYLPTHHHYEEAELAEVIAHENAHIRERHSWDVFLIEIVTILCWLNPFIYLYKKSLSEVHEYAADQAVLKFSYWENYAQLLVRQQYRQMPNALSHQLIYSQLKNRLHMMTRKPSDKTARFKYIGIIPAVIISMLLFSFTNRDALVVMEDHQNNAALVGEGEVVMPRFPGCDQNGSDEIQNCTSTKLNAYILENLVYPESLKQEGRNGMVVSKFVIGIDGRLKNAAIVRSFQADADLAVLNLLIKMNEEEGLWTPGTKDGKPADIEMVLPVQFQMAED